MRRREFTSSECRQRVPRYRNTLILSSELCADLLAESPDLHDRYANHGVDEERGDAGAQRAGGHLEEGPVPGVVDATSPMNIVPTQLF